METGLCHSGSWCLYPPCTKDGCVFSVFSGFFCTWNCFSQQHSPAQGVLAGPGGALSCPEGASASCPPCQTLTDGGSMRERAGSCHLWIDLTRGQGWELKGCWDHRRWQRQAETEGQEAGSEEWVSQMPGWAKTCSNPEQTLSCFLQRQMWPCCQSSFVLDLSGQYTWGNTSYMLSLCIDLSFLHCHMKSHGNIPCSVIHYDLKSLADFPSPCATYDESCLKDSQIKHFRDRSLKSLKDYKILGNVRKNNPNDRQFLAWECKF